MDCCGWCSPEASVNAGLASRITAYELAHPGTVVVVHSARANLYTATPSGFDDRL